MKIREKRGITLISLVVTIVVLLILAGVSISMLVGDNGIIRQATSAKKKTEIAEEKEMIVMAISAAQMSTNGYQALTNDNLSYELIKNGNNAVVSENEDGTKNIIMLDSKRIYILTNNGQVESTDINFDNYYVAPSSQDEERNNGVIGIGTDGNPVDMDLWQYSPIYEESKIVGYVLNDEEALTETGTRTSGYSNDNVVNGRIQGNIPQYIKISIDNEFKPVTHLNYTFYGCTDLEETPIIPSTVVNMRGTFNSCSKLKKSTSIPNGVINMYGTFANCTSLEETPQIANTVTNMYGTFNGCTKLTKVTNISYNAIDITILFKNCSKIEEIPSLPNSVTTMEETFFNCNNLIQVPAIPDSVTNMQNTFYGCTNLKKMSKISNNVINMYGTFRNCINLEQAPTIPNSVEILCATFYGCSNLQGTIEINANVTGRQLGSEFYNNIDYNSCLLTATTVNGLKLKVTGTCTILDKIVENANNPNITK